MYAMNVLYDGKVPRAYKPSFRTVMLHRAGSSMAVYLPSAIRSLLHLERGDALICYVVDGVICLEKPQDIGFRPNILSRRAVESEQALKGGTDATQEKSE